MEQKKTTPTCNKYLVFSKDKLYKYVFKTENFNNNKKKTFEIKINLCKLC